MQFIFSYSLELTIMFLMIVIAFHGFYIWRRQNRILVPKKWTDDYTPTPEEIDLVQSSGQTLGRSAYMIDRARMNKSRVDASIKRLENARIIGANISPFRVWTDEAQHITEHWNDLPIGSESWYNKNPLTVDIINCIGLYLGRDSTSKMPANTIRIWLEYLADKRTAAYIEGAQNAADIMDKKLEWFKS